MVLNGWVPVFLGGAMGPVVAELAKLAQMREKARISKLYSRPLYWVLTIPLVLLGGLAAIAHGTESVSIWTALQLGATAPLLFSAIASGRRPPDISRGVMPKIRRTGGWDLLRW